MQKACFFVPVMAACYFLLSVASSCLASSCSPLWHVGFVIDFFFLTSMLVHEPHSSPHPLLQIWMFWCMLVCLQSCFWFQSGATPSNHSSPTLHKLLFLSECSVMNLTLFLGSPGPVGGALCCRAPSSPKGWFAHGCGPALTLSTGPGCAR